MRHWTQDGAHGAGAALVVFGIGMVIGGRGWPALALAAVGALLLLGLRALETRDGWKQATDALTKVAAHEERLAKVEKEAEEARKRAVSAQVVANARGAVQRQDF